MPLPIGNLAVPFSPLKRSGIAVCLDGLEIAVPDAAYAQHQSVLAQFVLIRIEIDRKLGRALWRRLRRLDQWDFLHLPHGFRRKSEFYLDFALSGHYGHLRSFGWSE